MTIESNLSPTAVDIAHRLGALADDQGRRRSPSWFLCGVACILVSIPAPRCVRRARSGR
jgi:hypothetical protein